MNNQAFKVRPEIVNVNSNEPLLYPFSIKTSVLANVITLIFLCEKMCS